MKLVLSTGPSVIWDPFPRPEQVYVVLDGNYKVAILLLAISKTEERWSFLVVITFFRAPYDVVASRLHVPVDVG